MTLLFSRIIFTFIIIAIAYFALARVWTNNVSIVEWFKKPSQGIPLIKNTNVQMMRPLLQIESTRRDDGVAIQYKREGNRIWFLTQLKVENNGKASAENIVCLKGSVKFEYLGKEEEVEIEVPASSTNPSTRGPGQKFIFERRVWMESDNPKFIDEILREFLKGKVYITIDVVYEYTDSSKTRKYNVSGIYKIRRTNTAILDYKAN